MNEQKTMNFNRIQMQRRRVRRATLFFDAFSCTVGVLCGILIIWLMVSWVDFCAHDLSRNFDFWLGKFNLVEIICSVK